MAKIAPTDSTRRGIRFRERCKICFVLRAARTPLSVQIYLARDRVSPRHANGRHHVSPLWSGGPTDIGRRFFTTSAIIDSLCFAADDERVIGGQLIALPNDGKKNFKVRFGLENPATRRQRIENRGKEGSLALRARSRDVVPILQDSREIHHPLTVWMSGIADLVPEYLTSRRCSRNEVFDHPTYRWRREFRFRLPRGRPMRPPLGAKLRAALHERFGSRGGVSRIYRLLAETRAK